jgi:hypothetical protein
MSAQQMARHLSQVMRLHGSNARRGGQEGSSFAGEEAAKLSAMAEQPDGSLKAGASGSSRSLTEGFNAAAAAGGPAAAAKPALVASADGCSLRGAQQRDWALLKLQALVDAVEALEAACLRERAAHYNAGEGPHGLGCSCCCGCCGSWLLYVAVGAVVPVCSISCGCSMCSQFRSATHRLLSAHPTGQHSMHCLAV